jgi:hypothetical protein
MKEIGIPINWSTKNTAKFYMCNTFFDLFSVLCCKTYFSVKHNNKYQLKKIYLNYILTQTTFYNFINLNTQVFTNKSNQ